MSVRDQSNLRKRNSSTSNVVLEDTKKRKHDIEPDCEINVVDMSDEEETSKSSALILITASGHPLNSVDHPLDLSVGRKSTAERSVSFHSGYPDNNNHYSGENSLLPKNGAAPFSSSNLHLNCLTNGKCHHPCRTRSVPATQSHQSINFTPERCKSNSPFSTKNTMVRPSVIIDNLKNNEPSLSDVEEHFRKSLGGSSNSDTSAKVDDHFARALGTTWHSMRRTS